jgi:phosphate:Na+ symporter
MAKRAALIHFVFNIIGTTIIVALLLLFEQQLIDIVQIFSRGVSEEIVNGQNRRVSKDIADMNTLFKFAQVVILAPFSNLLVKLTYLLIPGDDEKVEETKLQFIGNHTVYAPSSAVPQALCEIEHMGRVAITNLGHSVDALLEMDESKLENIYAIEKSIDEMNAQITNYLVKINQMQLPVSDRKELGGLFHVVNDIERIGDHAENIADFTKTMIEDDVTLSSEAQEEVREMYRLTGRLLDFALNMFKEKTTENLSEIMTLENTIDEMEKEYQHNHVVRLTEGKCDAESGMIFSDLVSNLERVADHGTNIAFSILEDDSLREIKQA